MTYHQCAPCSVRFVLANLTMPYRELLFKFSSFNCLRNSILDNSVNEYNYERPHEALDLETPGSIHEYSPRPFKEKIEEWVYPPECEVRRVTKNGALRWKSTQWVMVSTSLIDMHVGLEALGDGIWRIYFWQKMLG